MNTMRIIVALSTILIAAGSLLAQGSGPQASPVVTDVVTEEVTPELKSYVGTVLPLKRTVVGSAVDGRVVSIHAEVGDRVEAKGALAQLLTETISLELAAAKAELILRQEELKELEQGSRPEEIEQAKARLLAAEAFNEFTQARARRNMELYRKNGVSSDEVEESLAIAERSAQEYQEAKSAHELAVAGPREERKAQARARVAMQAAVVRAMEDRIAKHTIITRFAGYVVAEHAEEGQWVKQGDPVAEVVALDQVEVEVHVVEQSVNQIHLGGEVSVEIPAFGAQPLSGKVSAIVPQADVRTRTFPVRILLSNQFDENDVPRIKSGMYARAKLPTGGTQKSKLIPKDALVLGGPQPVVYVVAESKVKPVPVTLGDGHGDRIQVTGELKADDPVVVVGNERLRPGQAVEVIRTVRTSVAGAASTNSK